MENCADAQGKDSKDFLSVTVQSVVDQMQQTGMVEVKVNWIRLTENGRWSLLRNFQGKAEKVPGTIQEVKTEKVQGPIKPGALFAANSKAIVSLGLSWGTAELLLAHGAGKWDVSEFRVKVVGKAPTLVLLESDDGLCGGYAAVPWPAGGYVSDPWGASFVFSIKPKVERFPLIDEGKAIYGCSISFGFGALCLWIGHYGEFMRQEKTYAVPKGWARGKSELGAKPKFTRFEVWHLKA
jgi:hypothetical protein